MYEHPDLDMFKDILEKIPMGVIIYRREDLTDPRAFRLIFANPAANLASGTAVEALVGRSMDDAFPGNPPDFVRALGDVVRTGRPQDYGRLRYEDARVSDRIFSMNLVPIKGNCVGLLYENITALERAEAERELAQTELARSNAELERFGYAASHDLQEPFRKIQTFGDRLKSRHYEALDDKGRDYLDRMQHAAERGMKLIEDLLSVARVTTKAHPFVAVDINQVAQEVVSDLEIMVEREQGQVSVEGVSLLVEAEPTQMRQLLQNLIENGLKFHRDGEPPVVEVATEQVDGPADGSVASAAEKFCQIRVQDNGIGFDEKHADRIFGIFQRLHDRSSYSGTGIGLALCEKIVQRHHGTITARSSPGRGATFIATLPVRQREESEAR